MNPILRSASCSGTAELGGDHQIARVRVKRLEDESVRDEGTVEPGGVDEVDAEIDRASENLSGAIGVVGLAPRVLAREAYGTVAETLHFEVTEAEDGRSVGVAVTAGRFFHTASLCPSRALGLGDVGSSVRSRRSSSRSAPA